ncbi:TolC family protein [Carboxylicivirga sp. M1479]|uniref:TolC family protein n=1 Tax=Carboxylicivirga sp. M1479 TaxID=2594476 RepID=UPI001177D3BC|nr:TolC family protein [Carboxylicivirga sp. M1479]TRX65954.1 TolC family protein [Carboxylicivirga sp. M1479]
MRISIVVVLVMLTSILSAQQSIVPFLQAVEENNLTLKRLRAQADAVIVGNKTGLNPSNPQIEYIYQWGNTNELGNKQEFHVRQSFDFPSAYRYRKQMMNSLNEKAESDYLNAYNAVMLNAQQILFRIIYYKALINEYEIRLEHAREIAKAFHIKFDEGDANIIERNKADINLLNAQNDFAQLASAQQILMEQLQSVNGGQIINFDNEDWPLTVLPSDFELWFNENADIIPQLQSLSIDLYASQYNEKLNKAMTLPKLTGGYSSESSNVDKFKGVNVGITIPLWENKNTVKQAKLNTLMKETELADERLKLYHGLRALYHQAQKMQQVAADYDESLSAFSNAELLQTALENGQITILEYMVELSIYYQAVENALNAQLNYHTSLAQMKAFQLN